MSVNPTYTALLLALACAACAAPDEAPRRDQAGNVYPAECRGDLSALEASATITMVDHDDPLLRNANRRSDALGYSRVIAATYPIGNIYISNKLTGWKLEDAKRHELCHVLLGEWHR